MSGFTIPGLGFAKPNETLPPVPADLLAAAASFDGVKIDGDDTAMTDTPSAPAPGPSAAAPSAPQSNPAPETTAANPDTMMVDDEATSSSLTGALEAFLGADQPAQDTNAPTTQPATADATAGQDEHPEWEIDSSPYESSSESSSSDSSDDDDDDEKEAYELLSIEETARMLMAAESDDEGEISKAGTNTQLRTKNEIEYEPVPKPDVTITPEMKITELGAVDQIVENIMVVKAFTPGEYQVLDTGSVLCTTERVVVGAIAETIGKVLQPMYTVMFSTPEDITELGITVGTKICYPVDHAKFVFTEPLRSVKGSDASNIHDEEVAEDEMEFSDDEREAEYKKAQKQKRREKSGRGGPSGSGSGRGGAREPHPLRNEVMADTTTLNYDDEDDGPYKPLQRPASFGQGPPIQQSYIEEPEPGTAAHRFGAHRGGRGGRGGGRGKDRGRGGRGGRGRGGGGGGHGQRGPRSPEATRHHAPDQSQNQAQWNAPAATAPVQAPAAPAFNFPFQMPPAPQQAPQHPPQQAGFVPPPPPGWPGPQAGQQQAAQPHFNPAFFAALLGQMQRGAQGGQQPQWPPQPPPQQ
ncbi:putative snoRNP assembly factor Naf1 [Plectosphaerella plurivora]|uniref:H/ACA ribonucleoprotein complex non-core subunit NAF1 n=1 Tax=Plectosphaerella plurivora TaxID=936078 RepID=A0A9P9A706_9PEZI|nr:putative snoRNP assembly factor Naf1 [Plectosphaerella plurivora]